MSVAFTHDGRVLASGSVDRTVRFWDLATGKPIGPALAHEHEVTALAFRPDDRELATGCKTSGVRLWRIFPDLPDSVDHIRLAIQVGTGLRLDEKGTVHEIDSAEWLHLRDRLRSMGGPPAAFEYTPHFVPPKQGCVKQVREAVSTQGLRGEYYQGIAFDQLLKVRVDPQLAWDGQEGSPDLAVPTDHFSIRWTGSLKAPMPGRYTLVFRADDGVRLWLDGKLLIDAWRHPQDATHRCEVELTGKPQRIKIEYYENEGWAAYKFAWVPPGATDPVVVPSECLSPLPPPQGPPEMLGMPRIDSGEKASPQDKR